MIQSLLNYIPFFKIIQNENTIENDTEISDKLKFEVLNTFVYDPFKEDYYDRDIVMKYIKFIMSIKHKCSILVYITRLEEFREFRKNNPIRLEDAYKLDKNILGNSYGGRLWTSSYDYPPGVGIFTFN